MVMTLLDVCSGLDDFYEHIAQHSRLHDADHVQLVMLLICR